MRAAHPRALHLLRPLLLPESGSPRGIRQGHSYVPEGYVSCAVRVYERITRVYEACANADESAMKHLDVAMEERVLLLPWLLYL